MGKMKTSTSPKSDPSGDGIAAHAKVIKKTVAKAGFPALARQLSRAAPPSTVGGSPTPSHGGLSVMEAVKNGKDISDRDLEKCDVEVTDAEGKTALHHACAAENVKNITALLQSGADREKKDNNGDKPRDLAPCPVRGFNSNIFVDKVFHDHDAGACDVETPAYGHASMRG